MGALVGLVFAVGALFVASSVLAPRRAGVTGGSSGPMVSAKVATLRRAAAWGLGCFLAGLIATDLPVAALLAGIVGLGVPGVIDRRRARRVAVARAHAWPDVIDSLVSAVRAGMSLPEAVCAVSVRGPGCLRAPFAAFAADYRSTGRFETCLVSLRNELADPVADRITEALLAARDVGGTDLGRMLRTLADFVRQDLRLRGEAEARASWTVNGAKLAVGAPWIVLMMLATRPGTVEAYRSSAGTAVLVVAAIVSGGAYWLMVRIGRLPKARRVLS